VYLPQSVSKNSWLERGMMEPMWLDTSASRKQLVNTEAKERNSKQFCQAPMVDLYQ
jgi:hypothetical protein